MTQPPVSAHSIPPDPGPTERDPTPRLDGVSGVARALLGFGVLVGFLALGGLAHDTLGLPVPGSVLGMVLLWGALEAGLVRLAWVQDAAGLLLGVLGLLFVPAGAGWAGVEASASTILGALAVLVLATVVALGAAGRVAQLGVDDGA